MASSPGPRGVLSLLVALLVNLVLVLVLAATPALSDAYTHLSYPEIIRRLNALASDYPNLLRIYSAQDRFSLPHVGTCAEFLHSSDPSPAPTPCTIWVVEMSNFDTLASDPARPEWLVSGEVHGDEVVGPLAVLAFIDYMVSNYHTSPFAQRMLNTRLTTLVPMTNAQGYFNDVRHEVQTLPTSSETIELDPNRDFPIDQTPDKCMQTVTARALNELYRVHLFRLTITFHGGTNALGYEWGDMTHCKGRKCDPAPDTYIMQDLGLRMSSNAGPAGSYEKPYPVGDMGKLVYPVNGGLEDWSYGASWVSNVVVCDPTTLGGYPSAKTAVDRKTKRSVTYLVETSTNKKPEAHTLGSSEFIEQPGGRGDGHVPRNVRLLFSAIDVIEPYIILDDRSLSSSTSQPQANWTVSGAFHVDSTMMVWSSLNGSSSGLGKLFRGEAGTVIAGGNPTQFSQPLPNELPTAETPLYLRIAAIVDQEFAVQPQDSSPDVSPQSHLMGARASSDWMFNVGDHSIRGRRLFFSETVMIGKNADGMFSQSLVKDALWVPESRRGHLRSPSDDSLIEFMEKEVKGELVNLGPIEAKVESTHLVMLGSVAGVAGIVFVGLVIYLIIRRRRSRGERSNRYAFSLGDIDSEKIVLVPESVAL